METRRVLTPTLDLAYQVHEPWPRPPQAAAPAVDLPPVILLHGWPDSPRTWRHLAPHLAAQGRRVVVPWLRGFGPTRFLQAETPRSGQFSALAQDLIDLADALGVERFDLVGHDWGARAAYSAALLWPRRVRRCVAISVAWGTNQPTQALSYEQSRNYWYHWFMHLPRGQQAVREDAAGLARYLWRTWSPGWDFDDDEFAATAADFANPDWAEITLHSYTHRWGAAPADPRHAALDEMLRTQTQIAVPTLHIHGAQDGANGLATVQDKARFFTGGYTLAVIQDCGHFPQREHPERVSAQVAEFLAGEMGDDRTRPSMD